MLTRKVSATRVRRGTGEKHGHRAPVDHDNAPQLPLITQVSVADLGMGGDVESPVSQGSTWCSVHTAAGMRLPGLLVT